MRAQKHRRKALELRMLLLFFLQSFSRVGETPFSDVFRPTCVFVRRNRHVSHVKKGCEPGERRVEIDTCDASSERNRREPT